MNSRRRACISLCYAVLTACGGGAVGVTRPSWVEGESPRWTRAQNVLGVGSADTDEGAADLARGEISRIFSSAVRVDTSIEDSETNLSQDGRTNSASSQFVAQSVKTASKKMLEGVEIVERWKDAGSSRSYALAVLNKSKALGAVTVKTAALDAEASQWKARLDAAGDKFERARAAAKLSSLLKDRLDLENDCRVLGGDAMPSAMDAATAHAAAAKAFAALEVVVITTGDNSDELATGIVSGLVVSGLMAKRGNPGDKSDLIVESRSEAKTYEAKDKRLQWSLTTAVVTLKDGRADNIFSRFNVSERQASANPEVAGSRAAAGLAKKSSEKTASAITAFFLNQ